MANGRNTPLFQSKRTQKRQKACRIILSQKSGAAGKAPRPAPFVSYYQLYLHLGKLSRNCYRFLKIVPLDFPAAVYYNKFNFILLKTLRRTTDAGFLSQRGRGWCKRPAVPAPYHRRVRGRTSAGPRPVINASSGALRNSGGTVELANASSRVRSGWSVFS